MRSDVFAAEGLPEVQNERCKPSPKQDDGAICVRWVRCGRSWCRCIHDGPKHGPYYARYWWQDGRRLKSYVRQGNAPAAIAACEVRRAADTKVRADAVATHEEWRRVCVLLREVERGEY